MSGDALGIVYGPENGLIADGNVGDAASINRILATLVGAYQFPPNRTILIEAPITLGSTQEIIIPPSTTLKAAASLSGAMFTATGKSGVIIWNQGTIDGNGAATIGIDLTNCPGPIVHDGKINNCTVAAVRTNGCDDARVQYVTGDGCSQANNATFYNTSGSNRIKFLHLNVTNPADGSRGIAIHTDTANCEGPIVDSCVVDFSPVSIANASTLGIETYGSTAHACPHGQVRNCKVYTPFAGNVYGVSVNLQDGEVSGCYVGTKSFQTTLGAAITSTSATSATVAAGIPFTPATGVTYYFQIDLEIIGVTAGVSGTAWTITRGQFGTVAATHLINAPVTLLNYGVDIGIECGTSGTRIVDNTVDGIAAQGIAIDGSFSPVGLIVGRNIIRNANPNSGTIYGIQDTASTGSTFAENILTDAGGRYLFLNNTNGGHKVASNTFRIKNDPFPSAERHAIDVGGGNGVTIILNTAGPDAGGTSSSALQGLTLATGSNHIVALNSFNNQSPDASQDPDGCILGAFSSSLVIGNYLQHATWGVFTTGGGTNRYVGNGYLNCSTIRSIQATDIVLDSVNNIGTATQINGLAYGVTATSAASYTVAAGDSVIYHTAGASNVADLLPAATGSGRVLEIVKADSGAGAVVVTPNGTDKINGASTVSLASQNNEALIKDIAAGEWHQFSVTGSFASPTMTDATINGVNLGVTDSSASSYSVAATDSVIYATGGAGGMSVDLPVATGSGRWLTVVKADSGVGNVTVAANGADKINGFSGYVLRAQYNSATLHDGAAGAWECFEDNASLNSPTLYSPTVSGALQAIGSAPTIAVAANAGSGATVVSETKWVTPTDMRMRLQLHTGTGPAAGELIDITSIQVYANYPVVLVTPGDVATAALQPYADANGTSNIRVGVAGIPAAGTNYTFNIMVAG